jgi:tetratricopeptide (TPR) repeat protein
VLEAAAIAVGRAAQAPILAAVLECPERAVLVALDAAWQGRLLEEANGVYRFPHDLIRETLEADLGPARRAMLHRRTAEALEAGSGMHLAEMLAYHYARSDVPDRSVPYLEEAGDHALSQLGSAAAVESYRAAVERLDGLGMTLEAGRVREKLGEVLRTGAKYADALQILESAAETYRAEGDLEKVGRVVAEIARVHTDRGTPAEGLTRLQPTLDVLAQQAPSRSLADLYVAQADLLFMLGRLHEDLAATEHGERIARLVGDDEHLAGALYLRGNALFSLGRMAEAVDPLRDAIRVAEASGAYFHLCWALMTLGWTREELGEFALGRESTERALQIGEQRGFLMVVAYLTMRRGSNSFLAGAWAEARKDFERAAALGREVGQYWGSASPALNLGALCVAQGVDSEASEHLEECERLLSSGGDAVARRQFACVVAERTLVDGRADEARACLASSLDRDGFEEEGAAPLLPLLAWALLDLGEVEQAAELALRTVAHVRDAGRQLVLVEALRVAGMVELRRGQWKEAYATLQEGLVLTRRMGHPYAEARLLQLHSELSLRTRQPERAQELLEGALTIFRRLNARKHLERVEQQLGALRLRQQTRR